MGRATLSFLFAGLACTAAPPEPTPAIVAEVKPAGLGGIEGCWSGKSDDSALCFGRTRTVFDTPYATMQSSVVQIDSDGGTVTIHERPECTVSKLTGVTDERRDDPVQAPTRLVLEGERLVVLGANDARVSFDRLDRPLPDDVCTIEARAARDAIWPPFWELVERTRAEVPSCTRERADPVQCCVEHSRKIRDALVVGSSQRLVAFHTALTLALARAYTYELSGAVHVVRGGCSYRCFDEVRGWLVAHGRASFERALEDPQQLGSLVLEGERPACPDLISTPAWAHEQRAASMPSQAELPVPLREAEPSGRIWTTHELAQLYPELCRRFGGC